MLYTPLHHRRMTGNYTITRCNGEQVTVIAIAKAVGDSIKCQLSVHGSFVQGIHVR